MPTKKNAFAIIATVNFTILLLYFGLRHKEQYVALLDAFVIALQIAANLVMAIIFYFVERPYKNKTPLDSAMLDEIVNENSPSETPLKLAKPFLLSALLVLLVGFGLCLAVNQ